MKGALLWLSGILLIALAPAVAGAAVIKVDPSVDDLEAVVESATTGDVLELMKGTHSVSATISVPGGVTITADPAAPHGSVVVQGGDNSARLNIFESTASDITISGLKFVPASEATLGGRAVWLALGGGDLVFNDNIVQEFTDALFAVSLSSGNLEFRNNSITVVDRDPDANDGFLGGNAALTVLFCNLASLDASGNRIHGPGRNVERFIAVSGVIVFNDTQSIGAIDVWNNGVKNFDMGIFSSGEVGAGGADIAENRLESNGAGVAVGQVPDPDITIPTPAESTRIEKNRVTGNDIGLLIASNALGTFIDANQIAGNRYFAVLDDAASGETTFGDNLIRGKDANTVPPIPPGKAFDPVTGPVAD